MKNNKNNINTINIDIEREYLINDIIAKHWQKDEYENLKQELNQSEIEINYGESRIEISQKEQLDNRENEIFKIKLG